jgi:UDP-GlcNAc:undecaprenyl-phosphate GlcNAc-1-phosphate transferase
MLTLTPLIGFVLAFLLAIALTPLARLLALTVGAVDQESRHKIHVGQVPRFGGIAIAAAFYLPVAGVALRTNLFAESLYSEPLRILALLGGGLVVLGLGIYDDLRGADAWTKLALQIPVAMMVWWAGVRVTGFSTPTGNELGLDAGTSFVATVLWIVGVVNAINLIDGLDGLASGIALQALGAVAICSWHRNEPTLALLSVVLAGAVGGFLVYNRHPASVFMGDSGSMFLGFVIAVASIWSSQKRATAVGVVLPAVALGLPLLDTSLAVWRRMWSGRRVMIGDLDHIHHRFLALGWSYGKTVLVLYGVGFFFSGLSVLLVLVDDRRLEVPVAGVALAAALGLAAMLGYLRRPGPARSRVNQ